MTFNQSQNGGHFDHKRIGPPKGKPSNNLKTARWKHAIGKALKQYNNDKIKQGEALDHIAFELVAAACDNTNENYQFAVKEIGLRLDGKHKEHIEIGVSEGAAALGLGISAAFASLIRITSGREVIDGEVIMSSGFVLPAPVCVEASGHGEGLDISEVQGGSGGT